ncbi:ArsR family transcriptional regulator [Acinetobacter rudis CIP 110305]|uniref:ArsR family transcriptional regulator n=2 Tax=Acinetobacter rudis TaxID=632955 RepID=S3PS33_9GAMM|nr:ArsR family transcriptional regulator [Acinetobacter rudis CIP 110305]
MSVIEHHTMDIDLIFKALSNPLRRQVLQWLKHPKQYVLTEEGQDFSRGICAGHIERLGNVSQSTMSNHLSVLQQAGLVSVQKHGQWCYFSRNDELIQQYIQHIQQTL